MHESNVVTCGSDSVAAIVFVNSVCMGVHARACQKDRGGRKTSECWPPLWSLNSWCQQQQTTTASPLRTPAPAPPVTNGGENGSRRTHALTHSHKTTYGQVPKRPLFSCRYMEETLVLIPNTIHDKHLNTNRQCTYFYFYFYVCVCDHTLLSV